MVNRIWYPNVPSVSGSILQGYQLLIGYPLAVLPPQPETRADLDYWREYLIDPRSIRVISPASLTIVFGGAETAGDLLYYRGYLGRV